MNMGTWGWRHWRRGDTVTWRQWGCSDTGTSWGRGGDRDSGDGGTWGWRNGGMEGRRDGGTEGWGAGGPEGHGAASPRQSSPWAPTLSRQTAQHRDLFRNDFSWKVWGGAGGGCGEGGTAWECGDTMGMWHSGMSSSPPPTVPVSLTHAPPPHCVPLQEAVRAQPRKWLWGGAGVGNRRWGGHCWGGHRGGEWGVLPVPAMGLPRKWERSNRGKCPTCVPPRGDTATPNVNPPPPHACPHSP